MVSGSYKGASVNVNDWLVVGALAVGAYFIYKMVVKPTSDVTGTVGDVTSEFGESLTAPQNTWQAGWNYLTSAINQGNAQLSKDKPDNRRKQEANYNTIQSVDTSNYVTNVKPAGQAYGVNLITVSTNKNQSSTVGQVANTFYPSLGIGFNSKNQGYSSFTPLKG